MAIRLILQLAKQVLILLSLSVVWSHFSYGQSLVIRNDIASQINKTILNMVTNPFELEFNRGQDEAKPFEDSKKISDFQDQSRADENKTTLAISTSKEFQSIVGYGAALTEASVVNILKLPMEQQEELLHILFDPHHGAALNIIRVPMGSSDLSEGRLGEFTYDDSPDQIPDPELKYFNMQRDLKTLGLIRRIQEINPGLRVMINPWTAPPWMKDNKSYYRGNFITENLPTLVEYFIRTIEEYHRHGLEVHYVGIQNEPGISVDYPSMLMNDDQQEQFIILLGEKLKERQFIAQIIANDDNYVAMPRVHRFLNNPKVREHIGVAGFHCWSNDPEKAKELNSSVIIFETECGGNNNSNNYGYDFYWWLNKRVIDSAHFGLSAVITWNMVSDEKAGPVGPGPQVCKTCRGLVSVKPAISESDRQKSPYQLQINSEFRAVMHASRFVKRGARRLDSQWTSTSKTDGLTQVVFRNPNGDIVVIIGNTNERDFPISIELDGRHQIDRTLKAGEAATLILPADS